MSVNETQGPHRSGIVGSAAVTRYRFVQFDTSEMNAEREAYEPFDSGEIAGVACESVAVGRPVAVVTNGGQALLEVNAASPNIAPGDKLKPGTGGVGVLAGSNEEFYAIARRAATTDGAVIDVDVCYGSTVTSG